MKLQCLRCHEWEEYLHGAPSHIVTACHKCVEQRKRFIRGIAAAILMLAAIFVHFRWV